MAYVLDDLATLFLAPTGNLDHVETRLLQEIAAARVARTRLKGLIGANLSALAALVVGTAVGVVQSFLSCRAAKCRRKCQSGVDRYSRRRAGGLKFYPTASHQPRKRGQIAATSLRSSTR